MQIALRRVLTSLLVLFGAFFGASKSLLAYNVDYNIGGTLGSVISCSDPNHCDPLSLAGTAFSVTTTLDSNATPISIGPTSATYAATLAVTFVLGGSPQTLSGSGNLVISISGAPTITLPSVTLLAPLSAVVVLQGLTLTTPTPSAFGSATINSSGSSITYDNPFNHAQTTTLGLSGSVGATTTTPPLHANPTSITANGVVGVSPPTQTINVTGGDPSPAARFTASFTPSGGAPTFATLTTTSPVPGTVVVAFSNAVAAGTYSGSIQINSTDAPGVPINIPVTYTVVPPPTLLVNPSTALNLSYMLLQPVPAGTSFAVAAGSLAYTVSAPSFISLSPASGTAPSSFTASINPAGLTAGTHTGNIVVTAPGSLNGSVTIPVTLTVAPAPTLTLSTNNLSFNYQIGDPAPTAQSVSVTGSTGYAFSASSSAAWLGAVATGTTPGSVAVSINPAGLAAGSYSGTVTISGSSFSNSPQPVTVSLTVTPALSVSPTALSFNFQLGNSAPPTQSLTLGGPTGASFTASTTAAWLSIPASGTIPGPVVVGINIAGLTAGTLNGSVLISQGAQQVSVPVTLVVSSQPTISATPTSLTFNYQLLTAAPASQAITVNGSSALPFSVTGAPSWLSVTPSSGTTPGSFSAALVTAGLVAQTYNATLTLTSSTSGVAPVNVPVTLVVTPAATLSTSVGGLSFSGITGGSVSAAQAIPVSASNPVTFTVVASPSWISVTPLSGATPGSLSVTANPAALAIGTFTGSVTVSSVSTSNVLTIPITFTVGPKPPTLQVSPPSANFTYYSGKAAPNAQSFSVLSTSTQVPVTASSSATWLLVSAGATTPFNLTASINTAGLVTGSYSAVIQVSSPGVAAVTIPVSLQVVTANTIPLTATPASLTFNYTTGQPVPAAQTVNITSPSSVPFTIGNVNSYVTVSTLGTVVKVTPVTAGLAPGSYTDVLSVVSDSGTALNIPVTINVSAPPTSTLTATPATLSFSYPAGTVAGTLSVTGTGAPVTYNVTSVSPWLSIVPSSGTTPGSVTINAVATGLAVGSYTGTVVITSPSATNSPLTVPVTFAVTAAPPAKITAAPSAVSFSVLIGGSAPAPQTVAITGTGGGALAYTASAFGASWLSVAASTDLSTLTLSVDPSGLMPGVYAGSVKLTPGAPYPASLNPAVFIPVNLTISAGQALGFSPSFLTFNAQPGGSAPVPQTISVSSPSPGASVQVVTDSPWITVSPLSGVTPFSATVTANATGLANGTYSANVSLISGGGAPTVVKVPVTVNVSSTAVPVISAITNGISYTDSNGAPGLIVSLWGSHLGPQNSVGVLLTAAGTVATQLGNTEVLADGVPCPLLFAQDSQVNAILPFSLAGKTSTSIQVQYGGVVSNTFVLPVLPADPAVFSADASGKGPGAILNADGTLNSAANPATAGTPVVIYAGGGGQTNPPGVDGALSATSLPLPAPVLPVTVTIGGTSATIQYAGAAPGLVAGVLQINAVVPTGLTSGAQKVYVWVDTAKSQDNITVFVK